MSEKKYIKTELSGLKRVSLWVRLWARKSRRKGNEKMKNCKMVRDKKMLNV